MCRIVAINRLSLEQIGVNPQFVFHALMLSGQAEGQYDGCGISDGRLVWRSGARYTETSLSGKIKELRSNIWLGHVRQASAGTERGSSAAHPYMIKDHVNYVIGAHNGVFRLKKPRTKSTDSEEFFHMMFENRHAIESSKELEKLLKQAECVADMTQSKYAVAYFVNRPDHLFVFRNSERELYMIEDGKGKWFALHTSEFALSNLCEFFGMDFVIRHIPINSLWQFTPEGYFFDSLDLPEYKPTFDSVYVGGYRKWEFSGVDHKALSTDHESSGSGFVSTSASSTSVSTDKGIKLTTFDLYEAWKSLTCRLRNVEIDEGVIQALVALKLGIRCNWWEMDYHHVNLINNFGSLEPTNTILTIDINVQDVPNVHRADVVYFALRANKPPTRETFNEIYKHRKGTTKSLNGIGFMTNVGYLFAQRLMMFLGYIPRTYSDVVYELEKNFMTEEE